MIHRKIGRVINHSYGGSRFTNRLNSKIGFSYIIRIRIAMISCVITWNIIKTFVYPKLEIGAGGSHLYFHCFTSRPTRQFTIFNIVLSSNIDYILGCKYITIVLIDSIKFSKISYFRTVHKEFNTNRTVIIQPSSRIMKRVYDLLCSGWWFIINRGPWYILITGGKFSSSRNILQLIGA